MLPLLLTASMALSAETELAGRYTHDYTEPADEPVWQVERIGDGFSIETLADADRQPAWPLDGDGRAAFWDRMTWPVATARDAQCITWGEAPLLLADLLAMPEDGAAAKAKPAPGSKLGAGVLCRVARVARERISWLSDHESDHFYFDSFLGVMEVRRLPNAP